MDTQAYLQRINYQGPLAPTAPSLRELHVAHMLAVPFENLDIHLGCPVVLEDSALFNKIVARRRGGFCYELNGLFAALLCALGFDVVMLSAGVAKQEGGFGPDFDHMALLVTLEHRWLADVGFGDSFMEPLWLDEMGEQRQDGWFYRIVRDEPYFILARQSDAGERQTLYRFTLQAYQYPDFAEMCRFQETSPQSYFTRGRICTRPTSEGRVTLSEMRLISTLKDGRREERWLANEEEYSATLREQFGINAWPTNERCDTGG